jgi:cell wall assembly regulator SMI1
MDHTKRNILIGGAALITVAGLMPTACAMRQIYGKPSTKMSGTPSRPAGQPKPILDEDIKPVLERLDAWYAAHLPPDKYVLNPPATDKQINAFESVVGIEMPRSYRQLYKWHNGENDDRRGHIYGLPILPLKRAAQDWQQWRRTLAVFGGNRYPVPGGAWPEGAVDPAYTNPKWIPLTDDGSGGNIGLDFDPWPLGRIGQVILYGRDEDVKVVLAESLGQFLGWIAQLLESGNYRLKSAPGEEILRQFRLKNPPTDHFHEGARLLLGAPGPFL